MGRVAIAQAGMAYDAPPPLWAQNKPGFYVRVWDPEHDRVAIVYTEVELDEAVEAFCGRMREVYSELIASLMSAERDSSSVN